MDYEKFIQAHRETDADITVAALPMDEKRATAFGLMKIDEQGQIIEFAEKPKGEQLKAMRVNSLQISLVQILICLLSVPYKIVIDECYLLSLHCIYPRLTPPFLVLMMKEQRKCLILQVWVYMFSVKKQC